MKLEEKPTKSKENNKRVKPKKEEGSLTKSNGVNADLKQKPESEKQEKSGSVRINSKVHLVFKSEAVLYSGSVY